MCTHISHPALTSDTSPFTSKLHQVLTNIQKLTCFIYECVFSRCKMWIEEVFQGFGCVLFSQFGWLQTRDHQCRAEAVKGKLSLSSQAVSNGVPVPPDGFLATDCSQKQTTGQVRLRLNLPSNLSIRLETAHIHSSLQSQHEC